ncbi:MAG: SpoIIE family protein phosphatase [Eubacterium sp.]|nr:SpoIIE family protein phosphatase [Eubacterium sp.]
MRETHKIEKKVSRFVILMMIGFMLGRVWIGAVNPFALAFLGVACKDKRHCGLMEATILVAMFTSTEGNHLIKYIIMMSLLLLFESFWEQLGRGSVPLWVVAVLCAGTNLVMGLIGSIWTVGTWENLWIALGEGVAVYAMGRVFAPGVMQIRKMNGREWFDNETLISLLLIVFVSLYGVPDLANHIFSITKTIGYFLTLFVALRQGAASGALAGLAAGLLGIVQGGDSSLIGFYSGLGVLCGVFRKTGKYISAVLYMLVGGCIIYLAGNEVDVLLELRSLVSGTLLIFAIPQKWLFVEEKIEGDREGQFQDEMRELTKQRISDFSDAFRRLAKSFGDGVSLKSEITNEELDGMMTDISRKLCSSCINCNYCWGTQKERTQHGMFHFLSQMESLGEVAIEEDNKDFAKRCLCFEEFLELVTENISLAKQQLGWKNRLARNREIMAKQMNEVSRALKGFTLYLGEGESLPESIREKMKRELEEQGIVVERLWAARKNGKVTVSFMGYYEENGCMTKTDIAKVLSRVVGVTLCPVRETRNVLSMEKQTMHFREDTLYRVMTGVARVARWDESVSGDNFSFLELDTGEVLMFLADGMGCGNQAEQESQSLVETLEYLLEAGFEKTSAWRLLNTLLAAGYERDSFSTLDLVSLNLYYGRCEFVKSGAAATYLYHDGEVEVIQAETLPVGVSMDASCAVMKRNLKEGDFVIMISDGVADGYQRNGNGDLAQLIREVACQNAQEFANRILIHALADGEKQASDDMTVLVAGIWNRPGFQQFVK